MMLSPQTERWLVDFIYTDEALGRALNLSPDGHDQRVVVLDRLAAALRLPEDSLGDAGYRILEALLEPLEHALRDRRSNWITDAETKRHRAIAEEAARDWSLDSIFEAFAQFGWQRQRLDVRQPEIAEIESAIRDLFVTKLAQRVFDALQRWRKDDVRPAAGRRRSA